MKKKLIAILLIAVMALTVLAGCDIITKNEERDLKQSIVTVNYNGLSANVTKGDISEAFNSYGYYYIYYYGYTSEQTFNLLVESLAQRKLLVLYARSYFAEKNKLDANGSLDTFLSKNELKYAIETINSSMEDSFKSILDELQKEIDATNETETEKEAPIKIVATEENLTYVKGDKFDVSKYQIQITADDGTVSKVAIEDDMYAAADLPDMSTSGVKQFKVTYEEKVYSIDITVTGLTARATRKAVTEAAWDADAVYDGDMPAKFGDEAYVYEHKFLEDGETENPLFKNALKELNKNMASNYKTYQDYLNSQYESLVLNKLQRAISADELTAEKVSAEITNRANILVNQNKEAFGKLATAFASTITSGASSVAYYPEIDYAFVYNILLKFSDEQSTELKKYASGGIYFSTEENYKDVRNSFAEQITVNISNLYYDAEYKCDDHDCEIEGCTGDCANHTCGNIECPANAYVAEKVPVATVLNWIYNDLNSATQLNTNAFSKQLAINEAALQWVFRVNDDSGMFTTDNYNGIANGGYGYLVTPEGEESTYVEEFTAQARALMTKYKDRSNVGNFTTDGTINGMQCITDYGIHVMVVSYVPYDLYAIDTSGVRIFTGATPSTTEDAKFISRELPLDYVIQYGKVIDADCHFSYNDADELVYTSYFVKANNGEAVTIKVSETDKAVTLGDYFDKLVRADIKSDTYNVMVKGLVADNYDSAVKVDEKKLKKMYE